MHTATKDTFRIRFIDAIRQENDPVAIKITAVRLLGEYTGANRVGFADIEPEEKEVSISHTYANGVPVLEGIIRFEDFGNELIDELRKGQVHVLANADTDPTLTEENRQRHKEVQVCAALDLPVVRNGQLKAVLFLHYTTPQSWTEEDIRFCDDIAQRTWDTLARMKAEAEMERSRVRQAFLLQLSDSIRSLRDALEIQEVAAALLGEYLTANRVGYAEAQAAPGMIAVTRNYTHDVPPIIGVYHYDTYGPDLLHEFKAGRTVVRSNIPQDPYITQPEKDAHAVLQLGATVNVPMLKSGQLAGVFFVHFKEPHPFTPEEVWLIEEVADRTTDAVQRARAEEALRISEERSRIALVAAEMGAWDRNLITDTVIWNDQHALLFGLSEMPDKVPMDAFLTFVHPADADSVEQAYQQAIDTNGTVRMEYRIRRADTGEYRWMSNFGRVVETKEGKALRIIGVMQDITERKEMERQREDFLGIASHELKTPVTAIKAYAEILQELFEEEGHAKNAQYMHQLDEQVDRLIHLIGTLLDTTKVKDGQLQLHKVNFDLTALIAERAAEIQHMSPRHSVVFTPSQPGITLLGDPERIGQVMMNLLSNAVKYSPTGGEVTVACIIDEKRVQVSVTDKGIGIPEEVQKRVFERFYRMESTRHNTYAGMGLGLYITAGIIELHGGKIWVESRPGKGSVFSFTLPLV